MDINSVIDAGIGIFSLAKRRSANHSELTQRTLFMPLVSCIPSQLIYNAPYG